jgi:hypothetical protein
MSKEIKKKKLKVEIEVWGIEIEQTWGGTNEKGSGWYKFEWSIKVNGGKKKSGQEDGSWSSQTKSNFRRTLNNGHAAQIVLQNNF